jgi:hypothetical protein
LAWYQTLGIFCDIRNILNHFWHGCKSGSILGPILLLSSVCALLTGVNFDHIYSDVLYNSGGVSDNNPGSGYVSLSHLPSRVERGSSAQFSNNNAKGNSDFGIFSDHSQHVFSAIGPTGAEIMPFEGLGKKFYVLPFEQSNFGLRGFGCGCGFGFGCGCGCSLGNVGNVGFLDVTNDAKCNSGIRNLTSKTSNDRYSKINTSLKSLDQRPRADAWPFKGSDNIRSSDHFKHVFSVIGLTGAKIRPFNNYNLNFCPIKVHIDKHFSDHFEHVFSSIGPTGAEIWPFKGFGKEKNLFNELFPYFRPFVLPKVVRSTFSFKVCSCYSVSKYVHAIQKLFICTAYIY